MILGTRTVSKSPILVASIGLALGMIGEGRAAELSARWIGQDGRDFVGGEPGPSKNDYQDIHIALKGLPADRELAEVIIKGYGAGEWRASNKDRFVVLIVRQPRSTSADLYFEPDRREVGRDFEVKLKLDDGHQASISVKGGKADLNLRAPGTGLEVKWLGQDGRDRTGPGAAVGPDGLEDVHLALTRLSPQLEIKSVEVTGPGGLAWQSGLNPKGWAGAELVRLADKGKADLYFAAPRDLDGRALQVFVTYGNDRGHSGQVVAARTDPSKAMPKRVVPSLATGSATARWLGQDGIDTGPGDVHVVLDGLSPSRQVVAAALSDGVAGTWIFRSSDRVPFEAGPSAERLMVRRSSPTRLDLAFPPVRDESGATMTLRTLDQSGREEVIRFPGGPSDTDRRAPDLPPGSLKARPGDDLQEMVGRAGTVTLSAGVYSLSKPLILAKAVRIVGEAGSTLRFSQGADAKPWTAAIKIHAGGTSLEGFAVRFEGPIRWDRDVSFGPTVIGTTDDRDQVPTAPRFRIHLARLDLEGPASNSSWEEATHLIRLVTASSGRIEGNRLKGGLVNVAGGPWTILRNTHVGTLPGTFAHSAFVGRFTHDLTFVGNQARPEGPSGKTWRLLVLVQKGAHDLIKDNVAEGGIGPREDDPHPHENSPEVILTEAYRLHFEGKPAGFSPDGRVVAIPPPQGTDPAPGDALAILSGPQAGQWRTIVQVVGRHVYLVDEPISLETDAISIATGFVRETFEGNTVDCRGSGIAANLVLAGNHFGLKVLGNRLIGGASAVRLVACPSEEPVHWGWSHAPFLGGVFEGNLIEDTRGGNLGVEHDPHIKSTKGRVYMSLTMKDNILRWPRATAADGKTRRLEVGFAPSLDPKEFVLLEEGTRIEGADPKSAWVHAALVNGKVVQEAPLTGSGQVGAKAPASSRRH